MNPQKLTGNATQPVEEAWDAGAFTRLEVHCRVLKQGSAGGSIILQHAAVNEDAAYVALPGATWNVNTDGTFVSVTAFLRFVRWSTTGTIAGDPVALIDGIGKE
ncbi:hypothetical protein L6R53_20100 [Myxococcota bacterium]|nr:hypothetical protein [Myxococcota bacterium]